jgi:hypothetical protein
MFPTFLTFLFEVHTVFVLHKKNDRPIYWNNNDKKMNTQLHHFRNAWHATNSFWGKVAMVLFYSFVWLQIASGIWSLLAPVSVNNWGCMWDKVVAASDRNFFLATMKVLNVWILGFFWLAHHHGANFWNVFTVAILYLVQWLVHKPAIQDFLAQACPDDLHDLHVAMTATEIWIFAALFCAAMEAASIRNSTTSSIDTAVEDAPLLDGSSSS